MRIRDEIRLAVGALLGIQVLTMIAAVALLARMTPAIDQILEDNEKSIRAVERMRFALVEPLPEPGEPDLRRAHFERALTEAENNITEPSEGPVLEHIAELDDAALAGDPEALNALRTELWTLNAINRESMLDANARAKQLGTAGAWALVFLGLIGVVFSLALLRRARVKLINPVYEIGSVLDACRGGDIHRRFNPAGASKEFREIAEVVNLLVGEHFAARERSWEPAAKLDRVALLRLLDQDGDPTFVCDADGSIAAANEVALEALSSPTGAELREAIRRVCKGEAVEGVAVEPLGEVGFLCRAQLEVVESVPSLASVAALAGSLDEPVSDEPVSDSPGGSDGAT